MYEIVLYGNRRDQQIRQILLPLLLRHFEVHCLSDQLTVYQNGKPRIVLFETDLMRGVNAKNAILILKRKANLNALQHLSPTVRVVLQSDHVRPMAHALPPHAYVYTCGLSSKDYITFSSRSEETAVVSLQRSLCQLNGVCCEPMELPCVLSGRNDAYAILASAITLMLLGVASQEKMLIFDPIITSHNAKGQEQNSSANTNI